MRNAFRTLSRSPIFTLTAIVSIAVGIGANTAIFTVANALLFAPTKAVAEPSRLVDIGRTTQGRGFDTVSYGTYADLRSRDSVFAGVYALRFEPEPMSLGGEGDAERIYSHQVSASYFDVLGMKPEAGGFFRTAEEQVGVPLRKVVLSHAFWTSHYSADPKVAGTDILLNGDRFVIVGVAPRGFQGNTILAPDLWVPLTAYARGMPGDNMLKSRLNQWLILGGRLKPDVTVASARAWTENFGASLVRDYPDIYQNQGLTVAAASRVPGFGGDFLGPFLGVLMGIVALVLLVACTNLAGLLLARTTERARDVAIRLSLGASRRSLVGMLLGETMMLFGAGAAMAVLLASWMTRALQPIAGMLPFPVALDLAPDWRVLAFTLGLALITALATGLVPALHGVRTDLVIDLKSDSSAPRRQRMRHIFITAQLAFCLVLIITAGLFVRALSHASNVSPGFDVDRIDVATIDLGLAEYTDERGPTMVEELHRHLQAVPGVESVAAARMVALDGGGLGLGGLRKAGTSGPEARIETDWNVVSPEYFRTLGIAIVRGRPFADADRRGALRVAIVNERFARSTWPDQDPVGQILETGNFRPGAESSIERLTVVGVARDAKYRWIGEADAPFIYVPYAQAPTREVNFFFRRPAHGTTSLAAVRQAVRAFDKNLPIVRMLAARTYADLGLMPQKLVASLAGSLGLLSLLLAAVGVYGVTAYAVASRTREIGVRVALGADRARVVRLVFWQGARLAIIGGAIGLALSVGVGQVIGSMLFGVSPLDPITYMATVGALAGVTVLAMIVPARRAASIDPLRALRAE